MKDDDGKMIARPYADLSVAGSYWPQGENPQETRLTTPFPAHDHDFHTGHARCSICGLSAQELGISSGGRTVGPNAAQPDTFRVDDHVRTRFARDPDTGKVMNVYERVAYEARARALAAEDAPALNRTDVIAYDWGITRNPGEDDASVHVRIRRVASRPGAGRPPVPPMDWTPPPGFRLGDNWRAWGKRPSAKPAFAPTYPDSTAGTRGHCAPDRHRFEPATMNCRICGADARDLARASAAPDFLFEAIRDVERPEPGQVIVEEAGDPEPGGLKRVN